jgi:hypothetical protein
VPRVDDSGTLDGAVALMLDVRQPTSGSAAARHGRCNTPYTLGGEQDDEHIIDGSDVTRNRA